MRFGVTCLVFVVLAFPATSQAVPITGTDLWDVSQGAVIDATSGALNYRSSYRSDVANMLGGALGTIEVGNLLFKDYMSPGFVGGPVPAGYVHYVDWHTADAVTLRSFSLHASNEGMTRRAFNRFTLYYGGAGGPWTPIYDTGPGFTYNGAIVLESNVAPVTAQYFRAEFVQAPWVTSTAIGPRIQELDGFNTLLDGTVPEPAAALLFVVGGLGLVLARRRV